MASDGAAGAQSVDMELAWHLLTVLVRLGRPAAASELASAATLSVSSDLVERMCRIPGSPLRISGGGVVTASETAVLAFLRFAGLDVPAPRVSLRPPEVSEVRKWSGQVTIRYERKRKMPDVSCFSTKGQRLPAPDSDLMEHSEHESNQLVAQNCAPAPTGENQVMAKKVNALIFSWSAIDGYNIDAAHRNSIKAEITHLLHEYANKQQSLAGVSAFISSTHQQHNFEEQYHEQLQMPEEEHQQQQKPHEMQQQHPQKRKEQGWVWQNQGRKKNNKNCKRSQRRQKQQERNKRPRLSSYVRPGIHNQCGQPFSGTRRAPFTGCTRAPYYGPYDRSQPRRTSVPSLKPE